jgi:myo-inositol catabolism protein IolC
MIFPPLSSPADLWRDIRAFFATRQPHQWGIAGLSLAIPGFFALQFYLEPVVHLAYKAPDVIFVKQWNKGRTLAEIKAQQNIDAPIEREQRAEEKAAEAKQLKDAIALKKALHL